MRLVVANNVRRHEVNDVSKRAEKKSATQKLSRQRRTDGAQISAGGPGIAIANQFNRQNTADHADIANTFEAPKRFRSCAS